MSTLSLDYQRRGLPNRWGGNEPVQNEMFCDLHSQYNVLYVATLTLDAGQRLTGFTLSSNFFGFGNDNPRTTRCYLYTADPTGTVNAPPTGYEAVVTLVNQVYGSGGSTVSFAFTGLNITAGGTLYLWITNEYNWSSSQTSSDKVRTYPTAPAITDAAFGNPDLSGITLSNAEVTTGGTQLAAIGNDNGRTVNVKVKYGATVLFDGDTTTGSISIPVSKSWFTAAGITAAQTFTVIVEASTTGSSTVTDSFTVRAGTDMQPVIGAVTETIVQGAGNPSTYFPATYIAGISKVKVTAQVDSGSNAAIQTVSLIYSAGTVPMSYNSATGLYEATTPVLPESTHVTVQAADQRGMVSSAAGQTVTVEPYTPPSLAVDAANTWRCDSSGAQERGGSYWRAKATATFAALTGNALLQFTAQIQGVGSAVALTSGVQCAPQGGTLVGSSAYQLIFTVQDKVSDPVTVSVRLDSIARNVVIRRSAQGTYVGVGCAPSRSAGASAVELPAGGAVLIDGVDLLDILWPAGSVMVTTDPDGPAWGSWSLLGSGTAGSATIYYYEKQ